MALSVLLAPGLVVLVVNIILGFIALFLVNALFAMGINLTDPIVIILTALLGLPGVAIIVILKFLGISI